LISFFLAATSSAVEVSHIQLKIQLDVTVKLGCIEKEITAQLTIY